MDLVLRITGADKKVVTAEEVAVPGSTPKYAHPGSFAAATPVEAKGVEEAEYTDVGGGEFTKGGAAAAAPESPARKRRRKAKKRR